MAKNNGGEARPDEFDFFDDWDFAPYEDADSTNGDDLAGFDADELAGGVFDEEDDGEFAELFSAFDEVAVTAEQRESTLNYVLAHDDPKLQRAASGAHMRRPARKKSIRMRVGIVAACLAIVIAGAASWMLPISSVEVAGDDYAVKLGMNVYGVAVTAQAEDKLGQEVLDQTDVRNLGSDDARVRLQETFERLYPELTAETKQDTSQEPANSQDVPGSAGNASVTDPSGTPGMMGNSSATEAPSAQQQQGGQQVVQEPEREVVVAEPQNWESVQEDGGNTPSVQTNQQTAAEQPQPSEQKQTTYQMDQPDEGGQLEQQSQPGQQQGEPPQQNTQQEGGITMNATPQAGMNMGSPMSSDGRQSSSGER